MESQRSENVTSGTPHGVKRRAEGDLKEDQRLAKRFDLLNIDHNGKLYVPVPSDSQSRHGSTNGDSMHIDDTKTKVYINNLDDEIASIEAEENMVFLPDIEKKISKIPQHVLSACLKPTAHNQMVVYGVPASLSVPEEKDNVRRAIIESRSRARAKQSVDIDAAANGESKESQMGEHNPVEESNVQASCIGDSQQDTDAMDLG